MWGTWRRLNVHAGNVANWVTVIGMLTAGLTWISHQLEVLQPYGWPEAFFAGLFAALLIVLFVTASLALYRYFNPLKQEVGEHVQNIRPASPFDGKTPAPQPPPISTPELRGELVKIIAGVEAKLKAAMAANLELHKGLAKNLEDANLGIRSEIAKVSSASASASQDLLELLDYNVDQTTVHFLDYLIALAPDKALLPYPAQFDGDETLTGRARDFLARVQTNMWGTQRASNVANLLSQAQVNAEREIESIPPSERPQSLDPLHLRKFAILGRQCLSVIDYLEYERREADGRIRGHRPKLIDRLRKRNPN